jgi:hypothetical protein
MTDEQVTELLAAPPLIDYRTMFKRSDLDSQIKGLELFEKKFSQFDILQSDEYAEILSQLYEFWPEEEQKADDSAPAGEDAIPDVYALADAKEVKQYAAAAGIKIKVGWTTEDIREALRAHDEQAGDQAPSAEAEQEQGDDFDPNADPEFSEDDANEPEETTPTVTAASLRTQAGGLRNRFSK